MGVVSIVDLSPDFLITSRILTPIQKRVNDGASLFFWHIFDSDCIKQRLYCSIEDKIFRHL